jgi:uncharacterized protein YdiU (UPF0061 family)
MHGITRLPFVNSYARLHPAFYEVVDPTPLPDPHLVAFNADAAALLDLDAPASEVLIGERIPGDSAGGVHAELPFYLSGTKRLPGSEPIAQVYAGHQFGVWVPRLGDGRAFLLGEVANPRGERWDLHLKGGGQTRFSRFGDGRSVLRSAVREYLASEALHGLCIPSTRALAIVGSDLPVRRERTETAATLLRLSPSHVRFGTFQYFAARGDTERVRELADYLIAGHFPGMRADYGRFFGEICRRTGRLIARWMAAGFAHGVMNTDNMSVLGLTLDYGPYGFLDGYDAGFVCNHSDVEGRYAFDRQPAVGLWNCARLGEALLPLFAVEEAETELDAYRSAFSEEYGRLMRGKLGLATARDEDAALVRDALALLQAERVDYTRFFRCLNRVTSRPSPVRELEPAVDRNSGVPDAGRPATPGDLRALFADRAGIDAWVERYRARLVAEQSADGERAERMRRTNPKYVLRNWIAQEAIERAEAREFGLIEQLRRLFADPYAEHPAMERYAGPPAAGAPEVAVSCSS